MTTLTIVPNIQRKTARATGLCAAGELVSVVIKGMAAQTAGESLRLRAISPNGKLLAVFPQMASVYRRYIDIRPEAIEQKVRRWMPGIMAGDISVLSDAGISIRQAVVSDPQDYEGSHLIIVSDGEIPGDIMTEIRKCRGVDSVILR